MTIAMLMFNYITPVMYVNPSGHMWESWGEYWEWVTSGYKTVGNALSEEFVVDMSSPLLAPIKIGVSFVVNLEDEYIEFYPHIGVSIALSTGPSLAFGVLENYENPSDYRELFAYFEASYYIGLGYCRGFNINYDGTFNIDFNYDEAVKAYYIVISKLNVSGGVDYYY